jgi:hypothetical protein
VEPSARRPRGRAAAPAAALVALALSIAPRTARGYCLTSACGDAIAGTQCVPEVEGDCGEPLRWATRCTGFAIQEDGSRRVSANRLSDMARAAFDTWMSVDCGGGARPGLVVQALGRVACDALEYNSSAGNANIVVFRDDAWPHPASSHNVALTTTTFDPVTGELFDADIELNSADFDLTVSDESVAYDLESVLVHESGHFLGVGHTDVPESTMLPVYLEGDTSLRTLGADDVAAICALYPPASVDETCNPLPRHGFSPYCDGEQPEGDCRAASAGAPTSAWGGVALGLAAAIALRARRASRGSS